MMKWARRVGIGTVLSLSLVFCGSASAQQEYSEFGTTPSPYISLAGVYGLCNFSDSAGSNQESCGDELENSFGMNIRVGYRFNRWVAVEGQVEWMAGFDAKDVSNLQPNPPIPGLTSASLDTLAFTVNARFYPLIGRIQPYALIGLGGVNSWANTNLGNTDTFTSFAGRFGVGLDFYITPNIALTSEFAYTASTEGQATFVGWWGQFLTENSGFDPSYMGVTWGATYSFF